MMILLLWYCYYYNFDDIARENIKEYNPNRPQIPEHPYRMLIIGGSGSGKRPTLPNVISHQLDIDKIYLYAKDPSEAKYQLLTEKHEGVALRYCNGSRAFIKYSSDMDDTYENIEEYNPKRNAKY